MPSPDIIMKTDRIEEEKLEADLLDKAVFSQPTIFQTMPHPK